MCFDEGSDTEAIASWVQGYSCWQACLPLRYKKDWDGNEEAVVIKFAVRYTGGFVLVHTARMNAISSANKRVVTVTPLLR